MAEDNQILIPRAFIELFIAPGRMRPSESREHIVERHEWCEDMACMLCEHAQSKLFELGVTELDVLERMHLGLLADDSGVSAAEAGWIVHRLAELNWPQPRLPGEPGAASEAPG